MLNKFEKFAVILTSIELAGCAVVGIWLHGAYNYYKGQKEVKDHIDDYLDEISSKYRQPKEWEPSLALSFSNLD